VKALALEDRRGNRAVIAQAGFPVTHQISDFAAAQLMKTYALERASILFVGQVINLLGAPWAIVNRPEPEAASHPGEANQDRALSDVSAAASEFTTAIAAALGNLDTARLLSDGSSLAVLTSDGHCLAAIRPDAAFAAPAEPCPTGRPVRSPIRAAFRTVDLTHGLQQRTAPFRAYPIQALALGKDFAILALGGDAPVSDFRVKGLTVAPFSNDDEPYPGDLRVREAIRQTLARVGR
jgi:hypothetical protein